MKILWTFDPFEANKGLHQFGKKLITTLFDKKDSIFAAYVASNSEAELATAFNIPKSKRYSTYPKGLISDELKKMKLKNIKIEVLNEASLSLSNVVKKIVDYTKDKKIDLIIIATNSRKVLPRMVFGSFAETIVHMSICDLLIYHQKTKFNSTVPKNILYAHDFSAKGSAGLEKIIGYVKKWDADLTILHVPIPTFGMELHEFKEDVQKRVGKLEKTLAKQKIRFTIKLEYGIAPTSEMILNSAKKNKSEIVAVCAQSKQVAALLGGSVTRQVLRESLVPTLVLKV